MKIAFEITRNRVEQFAGFILAMMGTVIVVLALYSVSQWDFQEIWYEHYEGGMFLVDEHHKLSWLPLNISNDSRKGGAPLYFSQKGSLKSGDLLYSVDPSETQQAHMQYGFGAWKAVGYVYPSGKPIHRYYGGFHAYLLNPSNETMQLMKNRSDDEGIVGYV